VAVVGLVARFLAPEAASPRTRPRPPPGYGVREQCLPFTAAAALGLALPAPFDWGYCRPDEVPAGGRAFRSPVEGRCKDRVFYVRDDPAVCFRGNAFAIEPAAVRRIGPGPVPGLSFFDRSDQQDHVKLHLPYMLRTAEGVALLFVPALNRPRPDGLGVVVGLVETDWYASPVNLVLALPPAPAPVHVRTGEIIAQAVPIAANLRHAVPVLLEPHRRAAVDMLAEMGDWRDAHDRDRSAYKRLSRSRHGRLPDPVAEASD
jgi:hypothetical protein